MKIYVDNKKTIQGKMIYLDSSIWKDFNDSSIVLGTKVTVGLPETFDKIIVKIPYILNGNFNIGQECLFEGLEGSVYSQNGKILVSWKAEKIIF